MPLTPRRKRIALVVGALLLTGIGTVFWPLLRGPGPMQDFCATLSVGASLTQVREQATQHGYRISPAIEGRAFVHDSATFGRFTCQLQFGAQGLDSSVYSLND